MTTGERRFFLVERYIPSISAGLVGPAIGRLREASSGPVRHLYSVLVPEEETCLSVFEAPDVEAVEAANERARFQLDRIVEVEVFPSPRHVSAPLAGRRAGLRGARRVTG